MQKKKFAKGDFVIEYKGLCTKFDSNSNLKDNIMYETNQELSYCLEFSFCGEKYCIDATRDYEQNISRYINHVRNPNLKLFRPLRINSNDNPRVAMFAAKDIAEGDELFWNYFSTFNPVKCLLNSEKLTPGTRWIFSYLNKDGRMITKLPKGKRAIRSGVCCICMKYMNKISNHMIYVHKIKDTAERRKLILSGRQKANICPNSIAIKKEINFPCPLCKKEVKYMSTHLNRTHRLSKEDRAKIIMEERKQCRLKLIQDEK